MRAHSKPLTIKLGHNAMCEIANHGKTKLYSILTSWIPGQLCIHAASFLPDYDLVQRIIDICSRRGAHLLTHMSIHVKDTDDTLRELPNLWIKAGAMPALRVLDIGTNVGPVLFELPQPKLKLITFNMLNVAMWHQWTSMLIPHQTLEDLRIRVCTGLDKIPRLRDSPVYYPEVVLLSLRHLELAGLAIVSATDLIRLLDYLKTPSLEAVTLTDPHPYSCKFIYEALVSQIFPHSVYLLHLSFC
jgi:hypothetical protein